MRLINADDFIKEINNRCESAIKWGINAIADHNEEIKIRAEQAIATFCEASLTAKKMPTIDAEPVKHGKLLRTEAYPHKLYCGECFNTLIPNDEAVEQNWMLKPRYCMYCGAKLDEE